MLGPRHDPLAILPHDVFLVVLEQLDTAGLCVASQVSSGWRTLLEQPRLWRRAYFLSDADTEEKRRWKYVHENGTLPENPYQESKGEGLASPAVRVNWRQLCFYHVATEHNWATGQFQVRKIESPVPTLDTMAINMFHNTIIFEDVCQDPCILVLDRDTLRTVTHRPVDGSKSHSMKHIPGVGCLVSDVWDTTTFSIPSSSWKQLAPLFRPLANDPSWPHLQCGRFEGLDSGRLDLRSDHDPTSPSAAMCHFEGSCLQLSSIADGRGVGENFCHPSIELSDNGWVYVDRKFVLIGELSGRALHVFSRAHQTPFLALNFDGKGASKMVSVVYTFREVDTEPSHMKTTTVIADLTSSPQNLIPWSLAEGQHFNEMGFLGTNLAMQCKHWLLIVFNYREAFAAAQQATGTEQYECLARHTLLLDMSKLGRDDEYWRIHVDGHRIVVEIPGKFFVLDTNRLPTLPSPPQRDQPRCLEAMMIGSPDTAWDDPDYNNNYRDVAVDSRALYILDQLEQRGSREKRTKLTVLSFAPSSDSPVIKSSDNPNPDMANLSLQD